MKVLIAEDELVSGRLLEAMLQRWGYDVIFVTSGEEAWHYLQQDDAPQLAILDWMMPGMDGIEVCRHVRAKKRATYTYIMLLTAKREKQDIVVGLEAGADDYVTKPYAREELHWRLRIGERVLDLESRLQRKLTRAASADALTGVMNRHAFLERLHAEVHRTFRQREPMSVILFDIDNFTRINDDHGYLSGDLVLQEVADCLNFTRRPYDILGRFGADEFILCCPNLDAARCKMHADDLRAAVSDLRIILPTGLLPCQVTVSMGLTTYLPESHDSVDEVLLRVEEARYQAKHRGGNQVSALL